jgi:hypothetical protein
MVLYRLKASGDFLHLMYLLHNNNKIISLVYDLVIITLLDYRHIIIESRLLCVIDNI